MCQLRVGKEKQTTATENDDGKLNYHPAFILLSRLSVNLFLHYN